ncbi:hypothetical protein FKW77_010323 [Venturia effusa]|uniref:Uncharacterized protein n=1 Tax=Venturia effusa TaxID=50376 RepID=A0A517L0F4_9PEZI|nr:hypothetical protein FKW77_010323 [Venturia effusa]
MERKYRSSLVTEPAAATDRSYMSVIYSARGSDSWNSYLAAWDGVGNHTTVQSQRLAPWTIDRSTQGQINGSWVQSDSSTNASNLIVNNVTLAIPHPGILKAARTKSSSIAQPHEFDGGVGRYKLRAQVPSPYINIICTNIKRSDLQGLVYEDQVNGDLPSDALSIPLNQTDYQYIIDFDYSQYASVKTRVDEIFHWTESDHRPIFYRYPKAKQTIINGTTGSLQYNALERNSLYLLSAPETNRLTTNSSNEYSLCSIQAGLLADCSTELIVAGNSSVMTAHCGDSSDRMAYAKRSISAKDTVMPGYVAVGTLAATSVGLNNGELGYDADNMNYLTKLILKTASLPSDRPSIAEGLAAFLLPSLIMAAQDSPFEISPMPPSTSEYLQSFPAILTPTLYASGGDAWPKRLYLIVLVVVFLMNCYMLYYLFLRHRNDLKIDICDPMNLFGLAIASDFNQFPESKLILSPKKEKSERPLSTEWKILSDPNKKMEIVQVSPVCESGGSPNDAVRASGFTPLLTTKRWSKDKGGTEDDVEMV